MLHTILFFIEVFNKDFYLLFGYGCKFVDGGYPRIPLKVVPVILLVQKFSLQYRSIKAPFLFSFLNIYHFCPLTEKHYFIRSMTPSITQI